MTKISCVIFDMDGTLTQTNDLIFATFNHVTQKYVAKTFTPREIIKMFGPPEEVSIGRIVGSAQSEAAMDDFLDFYGSHLGKMASTYAGMKEILAFLKSRGVRLGIFTGKGIRTTLRTLEHFGIDQYFDAVVSGSDVNNHKPSPEGIRQIMEKLNVPPDEVLMVGDAVSDVKAAREAGVAMAAVLWDSYGKDDVMAMEVDCSFHTVHEFDAWLRQHVNGGGAAHR